jgi:hypothetical protein
MAAGRQRGLNGTTPDQIVAERLKARRKLANAKPHGRAGPDDIAKARLTAEAAKDVSQSHTLSSWETPLAMLHAAGFGRSPDMPSNAQGRAHNFRRARYSAMTLAGRLAWRH